MMNGKNVDSILDYNFVNDPVISFYYFMDTFHIQFRNYPPD